MERKGSEVFFTQAEQDEFGVDAVLTAEDAFKFATDMQVAANTIYKVSNAELRDLSSMPERPRVMWRFAIEITANCTDIAQEVARRNRARLGWEEPEV